MIAQLIQSNNMIKNIFVPTDFSDCAGYAVDAAIKFAERFGSAIYLYHCVDLPQNWDKLSAEKYASVLAEMQTISNAEIFLDEIKVKHPNIDISRIISGGNLYENMVKYIEEYSIDLIIMGSHGTSGKNEFFIGSHTQKAVRMIKHCPVLIVKDKIKKLDFKKVVYASGFNENERETFLKFKKMMLPFLPEIHLLAVHTSHFFDAPYILQHEAMDYYIKLAEPLVCKKHILRDFSVDTGTRSFAKAIDADLIGISNHYRHPLKRMLVGSNVEALVNHSAIPVMTIDY